MIVKGEKKKKKGVKKRSETAETLVYYDTGIKKTNITIIKIGLSNTSSRKIFSSYKHNKAKAEKTSLLRISSFKKNRHDLSKM